MQNVSDIEMDVETGRWTYVLTGLEGVPYLVLISFESRDLAEKSRTLMKNGAVEDALEGANIEITGEI